MKTTLFLSEEELVYQAPPIKETGTVRYAPSFTVRLAEIRIIGYVPRIVVDDESGFLALVTTTGTINYFNLDVVDRIAVATLESLFSFSLKDLPNVPFEDTNWHSVIAYPKELAGQPLFKSWSWFTLRGFLKNLGKASGTDNPMWERLTDEVRAYLVKNF